MGDSLVWDDAEGRFGLGPARVVVQPRPARGGFAQARLSDQQPDKLGCAVASVLSPANDTLAHRIQGRDFDAHFEAGELKTVDVIGNEVNYFEVPEVMPDGGSPERGHAQVTLSVVTASFKASRCNSQRHDFAREKGNDLEAFRVGGTAVWA